jgi:hypothetical protein
MKLVVLSTNQLPVLVYHTSFYVKKTDQTKELPVLIKLKYGVNYVRLGSNVAEPGSGTFFDPGSGIPNPYF